MTNKVKDMTGKRYDKIRVVSLSKKLATNGGAMWNCVCDCGKRLVLSGGTLRRGERRSCGCATLQNRHQGKAKKMEKLHGIYMSSRDPWYIRAAAIWQRAKANNIPVGFNTFVELAVYIRSIAPKKCPVFGKTLTLGTRTMHKWSPSVDKIIPSKGYVKGNMQVVSYLANSMKRDATPTQLRQFAQWITETA